MEGRFVWLWVPVFFVLIPLLSSSDYHLQLATQLLIFVIFFMGVDIAVGHAGLISIAHGALFGIGAYVTAVLSVDYGFNFFETIPFAIALASLCGLAIGLLTLKLAGHYFVIATMAFALLISIAAKTLGVTHGELGIANIAKPGLVVAFQENQTLAFYYLVALSCLAVAALYFWLMRAAFGRRLRAIRDNPLLADALGVDISTAKLLAFVVSASVAAFAGTFHAVFLAYINPAVGGYELGFTALMALIIGGRTTFGGIVIGAVIFTILPEVLRDAEQYRLVILGLILIVIVQRAPAGLFGKFYELAQTLRR